jgi:hypothetical protein
MTTTAYENRGDIRRELGTLKNIASTDFPILGAALRF